MSAAFNHQNASVIKTLDSVLKGTGYLSSHSTVTARCSSAPTYYLLFIANSGPGIFCIKKDLIKGEKRKNFVWDHICECIFESLPS